MTMGDMSAACWEAIDDAFPGEAAILVGCSVGSAIAPHMYHERPECTPALVLSGTGYNPGKPFARGRIDAYATGGMEPEWVMMAPVNAVKNLLEKTGEKIEAFDLFELNEAFAVQGVAVTSELGMPLDKTNVNGGAVALGHPIGASGARVLVTLIHALAKRGGGRGLATLCLGGGNAVAMSVTVS